MNEKEVEEKPKILGMVTQPTVQFKKIKQNPVIWMPLIIISLLMMVGAFITAMNIDYSNNPEIQEAIEVIGIDEDVMIRSGAILAGLGNLILPGITALITTVIYLVISKVIKKQVSFSQLFSMNTYILFISAIGVLLNGLLSTVLTGDTSTLFTSLAYVIPTDNIMLENVFAMIEIFTIWGLVLTIIGLQIVANFSKKASLIIVIGFYILSLLFRLFSDWIATML